MKRLKNSQVIALMLLQSFSVPILALSWGTFTQEKAWGFILGNALWSFYITSFLFDYSVKGDEANAEDV